MSFKDFNLNPSISAALTKQGYTTPTPIQQQAIPIALEKRDVLGCAQTGTGKTAAFVIPLLQMMLEEKNVQQHQRLRTLILAPTRELALQIAETVHSISCYTDLKYAAIFGGVPQQPQVNKIRSGVDILVATPGRLKDLMNQGFISLRHIKYLVLDEADRMLDMGFVNDVKKIIAPIPVNRQTLFFSATMPPGILKLANTLLDNPIKVEITPVSSTAEPVEQWLYYAEKQQKPALLVSLLQQEAMETAIVFTQMKHMADKLSRLLNKAGISADALHGNKSQRQRETTLDRFKKRRIRVLVATDIAARGIDIDKLGHVINFDLPQTAENYVHRIGRTGRAGSTGTAISICCPEEKPLLLDIQRLIKKSIRVASAPATALHVQQQQPVSINMQTPLFERRRIQLNKRTYGKKQMRVAV